MQRSRPLRTALTLGVATLAVVGATLFTTIATAPPAAAAPYAVTASTALNVRSGPGLNHRVIGVLSSRATIESTGPVQNGWMPITYRGRSAWVSAAHTRAQNSRPPNTTSTPSSTPTSSQKTEARTTAVLNVRTGAGLNHRMVGVLARNAIVQPTGSAANGFTQITYRGEGRWVATRYLRFSSAPAPAPAPPAADPGSAPAPVSGPAAPGSGFNLPGLTANTRVLLAQVEHNFPEVRTIYGVRPDSIPDHPSGRALDMMVSTNGDLGNRIATWAQRHATELNIDYIIWDQKIWSVARQREGWRHMADRGSTTANHQDHVHISVR